MGFVSIGIQLLRSVLLIYGSIRASRRLARSLLDKVVRLPMAFFDSQPTGERWRALGRLGCVRGEVQTGIMVRLAFS